MRNGWERVKKSNLCPVCNSGDWCLVQSDGTAAICARISEGSIKQVGDSGAGWLHKLTADPSRQRPKLPPKKFVPERIPNWFRLVSQCQQNLPDLSELSQELGLSMESLARLQVGFFRKCYTFPIRDGNNSFVGIRMRPKRGKKFSITGTKNALYWPLGVFAESNNILFLPEGATDTAAMLDLGFDAIGRPNNRAGSQYVKDIIKGYDRAVVIVSDKDEAKFKPDGTAYYPGQDGAVAFAQDIKEDARHVRVIKPPQAKDMRKWLQAGATAAMVMTLVDNARFI